MEARCKLDGHIGTICSCEECYDDLCSICQLQFCEGCNRNLCFMCFSESKKHISEIYCKQCKQGLCPSCTKNLVGDSSYQKFCRGCGKHFCIDCIAMTGCQTIFGECRQCYNYQCRICQRNLERPYHKCYLDDEYPVPVCLNCVRH